MNVRYVADMDRVAAFIRTNEARIAAALGSKKSAANVRATGSPADPVLEVQLPEFLEGLASWVEGNTEAAENAFARLAEGHAIERLGYGVGLETLMREYSQAPRRASPASSSRCPSSMPSFAIRCCACTKASTSRVNETMARYGSRREESPRALHGDPRPRPARARSRTVDDLGAHARRRTPRSTSEHRLVASRIGRACDRMQRMINDVLDFARGHLGAGIPAHPTPTTWARSVVPPSTRSAARTRSARSASISAAICAARSIAIACTRRLTNLISNAIHHTDGPIEICARESRRSPARSSPRSRATARVIPEDLRRRIFDPFAQGEARRAADTASASASSSSSRSRSRTAATCDVTPTSRARRSRSAGRASATRSSRRARRCASRTAPRATPAARSSTRTRRRHAASASAGSRAGRDRAHGRAARARRRDVVDRVADDDHLADVAALRGRARSPRDQLGAHGRVAAVAAELEPASRARRRRAWRRRRARMLPVATPSRTRRRAARYASVSTTPSSTSTPCVGEQRAAAAGGTRRGTRRARSAVAARPSRATKISSTIAGSVLPP